MRYGLSLLVCFALCVSAQAQCNGTTCERPKTVSHVSVNRVSVSQSHVSQSVTSQSVTKQVGPIRQFLRNIFRR